MKRMLSLVVLLLVFAGCTGTQEKEYLDADGSYVREKYLVYEEKKVKVRKESPSPNQHSKGEVLPYIGQDDSGKEYIGMEVRKFNYGGKASPKLMTIIADEEEYKYYLLFERSKLVKIESGGMIEEFDIEIDEEVLEKLSSANKLKIKFVDYNAGKGTIEVDKHRKVSYKLIYEEYIKRKGA